MTPPVRLHRRMFTRPVRRGLLLAALWVAGPALPQGMPESAGPAPVAPSRGWPSATVPLFTVDGAPVLWPEFSYWLKHARKALPPGADSAALVRSAVELARKRLALQAQARRLGIAPSEQDLQQMQARRDKEIRIYGGVAEYLRVVSRSYVSEQVYEDLARADLLGTRLLEQLYGADGENLPDQAFARYVQERQLVRAQVLFLRSGRASATAIATTLRSLRAELDGRPGAELVFERRVRELGEDQAATLYPDGRILGLEPKDRALHDLAAALLPGRFAEPLVTPQGVYLLQRLPLAPEHRPEAGAPTLRYLAAYSQLFGPQLDSWIAGQQVAYSEAFARLDLPALLR
ncbi:MAG TPA: hypothetical protein VLA16_11970 [Ideonella sp.]|nr:hypothetical protein [Ideonella sp.]